MSVHAQRPAQRTVDAPRQSGRQWTPTRNASGAPDIQGVWNYGTMTPLRAAGTVGRQRGVDARGSRGVREANRRPPWRKRRGHGGARLVGAAEQRPQESADVTGNRSAGRTSSGDDGRLSDTAAGGRGRGRGNAYEGPEVLSLQDRCIAWPAAGPPYQPTVYNNNVQIVQAPGYIMLLSESFTPLASCAWTAARTDDAPVVR